MRLVNTNFWSSFLKVKEFGSLSHNETPDRRKCYHDYQLSLDGGKFGAQVLALKARCWQLQGESK